MARSTNLSSYGPEYEQLLLRAYDHLSKAPQSPVAEFTLQLANQSLANSLRSKVYAYFHALRSSNSRPDLVGMLNIFALRVAGSALVFYRREDSWDAQALRGALGLDKGFEAGGHTEGVIVPTSGQTSAVEKLAEIRNRKK